MFIQLVLLLLKELLHYHLINGEFIIVSSLLCVCFVIGVDENAKFRRHIN